MTEDGRRNKGTLQRVERVSGVVAQRERRCASGLLGERIERRSNVHISVDEATVEVSKPKEGLNVLDRARQWPARNGVELACARFLDGFSGSAFLSVAGGTVGDMFSKEHLAAPILIYSASPFLGPGMFIFHFVVFAISTKGILTKCQELDQSSAASSITTPHGDGPIMCF